MKKYIRISIDIFNLVHMISRQNRVKKLQITYDPNNLFDALIRHLALKNDAALAKKLGISSLIINRIRRFTQPVSGTVLILIQEKTGFSFSELRRFMGDRRQKFRIKGTQLVCP